MNVALLIPNSDPVLADVAKVRWIDKGGLGLEFLRIRHADQVRRPLSRSDLPGASPSRGRVVAHPPLLVKDWAENLIG